MNVHNQIIQEILHNQLLLESIIELFDTTIKSEVSMSKCGDIDVLIQGMNYYSGNRETAIIEVKAHRGLVQHYIRFQLPKYKHKFPDAQQYVVYADHKNVAFDKLIFERMS